MSWCVHGPPRSPGTATTSGRHDIIPNIPPKSRVFRHATRPLTIAAQATAQDLVTFAECREIAETRGLHLTLRTLGPLYRVICRDGSETGPILAVSSGFTLPPFGLMHCDTLQIFTKGQKGEQGYRTRGGFLGLGLIVGGATFAVGQEQGCHTAEILAINDDDVMHARLVRYYSRFGFEAVREVPGGRLSDLPHMLVWGGVGLRMNADVSKMLSRWTPAIRNSRIGPTLPSEN